MRKRYSYEYPAPYRNIQRLIWFFTPYKLSVNSHIKEIACNHNGTFFSVYFDRSFAGEQQPLQKASLYGRQKIKVNHNIVIPVLAQVFICNSVLISVYIKFYYATAYIHNCSSYYCIYRF